MARVHYAFAALTACVSASATANDWERFFTALPGTERLIRSQGDPEVLQSSGDLDRDIELLWRRGYGPLGYTIFQTNNGKTADATRFGKKLGATHVVVATQLLSSRSSSVPLTLPSTTTSTTSGTANVMGSGGYATGTYTGTTTTYGTNTTYIPITINRFEKGAIYFAKLPPGEAGIFPRELTKEEIASIESQRAFAVKFIQEGSPAYNANLLPGDIITEVDGLPADGANWNAARTTGKPLHLKVVRNGQVRNLVMENPARQP